MFLANVPADMLVGAVEKLLSKVDETDLASSYEREVFSMSGEEFATFVEAVLAAFRERGESSDDAVEGAGTTLESIEQRDRGAVTAFVAYARENPGLLPEATMLLVEKRPDLVTALPASLREALVAQLTQVT